jgi:hypothetical protein
VKTGKNVYDQARRRAADLILDYGPEKLCGDWAMWLDVLFIVAARLNRENAELREFASAVLFKYMEDSDKLARLMNVADRAPEVDSWQRVVTAYVEATDLLRRRFPSLGAIRKSIRSRYGSRPPQIVQCVSFFAPDHYHLIRAAGLRKTASNRFQLPFSFSAPAIILGRARTD